MPLFRGQGRDIAGAANLDNDLGIDVLVSGGPGPDHPAWSAILDRQAEAGAVDAAVGEDLTSRGVIAADIHPDGVIRDLGRAGITQDNGNQLTFVERRVAGGCSEHNHIAAVVKDPVSVAINPDVLEAGPAMEQILETGKQRARIAVLGPAGDGDVLRRVKDEQPVDPSTVHVSPDLGDHVQRVDEAVELIRGSLIACRLDTGQKAIRPDIIFHVRGGRVEPGLGTPRLLAEEKPVRHGHRDLDPGSRHPGRIQAAEGKVGPAHRMRGTGSGVDLAPVQVAVIIRIAFLRIRAQGLLFRVGEAILVLVFAAVHLAVVVRVVVQRVRAAEELVLVGEAVAVVVDQRLEVRGAVSVQPFPPVGQIIAVTVIGPLEGAGRAGHDPVRIAVRAGRQELVGGIVVGRVCRIAELEEEQVLSLGEVNPVIRCVDVAEDGVPVCLVRGKRQGLARHRRDTGKEAVTHPVDAITAVQNNSVSGVIPWVGIDRIINPNTGPVGMPDTCAGAGSAIQQWAPIHDPEQCTVDDIVFDP